MTREWQEARTPEAVIELARRGNERFARGEQLQHDHLRDVRLTSTEQHPAAIVISCIDSRAPAEIIFDAGIGALFNARIAGNFVDDRVAGSAEFACKLAGARLVLLMGHTNCGAIKGAIDQVQLGNLTQVLWRVRPAVDAMHAFPGEHRSSNGAFVDAVARTNVGQQLENLRRISPILREMEQQKQIMMVGALYDVSTGRVEFLERACHRI